MVQKFLIPGWRDQRNLARKFRAPSIVRENIEPIRRSAGWAQLAGVGVAFFWVASLFRAGRLRHRVSALVRTGNLPDAFRPGSHLRAERP